ncbi:MAG: hypothetical protein EXR69_05800 [Myxococcales bacterium]|nr:hypothetical protein [Myxococcales bacterium]
MQSRHLMIPGGAMGRNVHLWAYGWWGQPVIAFPSAAGFAHEWHKEGMVDVLEPWIRAGKIKLYCPESNVSEAWTGTKDPAWRISRHVAYEKFVTTELLEFIRHDCNMEHVAPPVMGCSLGGLYAALMTLKHPELFPRSLSMSGRYDAASFTDGFQNADVYYNNPLAFVPNLSGPALDRTRKGKLTLVCGRGAFEAGCIEETVSLAHALEDKGIPHERDIWGRDSKHDWDWWRKQLSVHAPRVIRG